MSLYEELTRKGDSTRSLDAMINDASLKLGNSLILCDMKFRILSHSTSIPVTDELWKGNVERGFCDYDFIRGVMDLPAIRKAEHTVDAIEVSCPLSPHRKCSSKVFLDGVQVGFILMIEGETQLHPGHLAAMGEISRAVSYMLGRYQKDILKHTGRNQQLLEDLLIGTPVELLQESIKKLTLSDTMYAIRVQGKCALTNDYLLTKVSPVIQRIFPDAYMTIHDNAIAMLIPNPARIVLEENHHRMLELMSKEQLDVGISQAFSRIDHFYDAYRQASRVIEWDREHREQPSLVRYTQLQFFDLLEEIPDKEALRKYIHPALSRLQQYDEQTGNELYTTLDIFLQNSRNSKSTANQMNIHRNSLAYRLERILEVGQIDLEDAATRFALCLSYRIREYLTIQKDSNV